MSTKARFANNNWLYTDGFSSSSANASYPANNLVSGIRSKVWKNTGLFELTAANNVVHIAGSSFTVPVGSYSFATLVTAFATASGAYSLTLARSAAGLITITKAASTTYNLSTRTNAIWDALGMFSTTDVVGTVVMADERAYHTSEWFLVDMGIAQECTFAALIPPNGEAFGLSSQATVKLQGNNVNVWTAPNYDTAMEVDFRGAFLAPTDAGTHRYWRIKIMDPTNSEISAAVAYLGDCYIPVSTNIATGIGRSSEDLSIKVYSESGAQFVNTRPKVLTLSSMNIQFLKDDDLYDCEQMIYDLGVSQPFFICIDPSNSVSSSLSKMTHYVTLDGAGTFQHVLSGYYHLSFGLREVV